MDDVLLHLGNVSAYALINDAVSLRVPTRFRNLFGFPIIRENGNEREEGDDL